MDEIIRNQGFQFVSTDLIVKKIDNFLRRGLDVTAALIGLLLLWPFFSLISIAIKRDTPGPVFFRGKRAGQNGRPFWMLKFRTMYEDARSYAGPAITAQDDDRITPIGAWLRATKINELPQLWNVLIGDMSLVGPRPEDYEITLNWPSHLREEILSVRPGITSPASVTYHNEESKLNQVDLMDEYLKSILPSKLRLDSLYLRHRTILTDLDVIFWTFTILFPRLRNRPIHESRLLFGPFSIFFSRRIPWFVLDFLVAVISVGLVGIFWRIAEPLDLGAGLAVLVALLFSLVFTTYNAFFKLQDIDWDRAPSVEVVKITISSSLAAITTVFINHLISPDPLPDRLLMYAALLALMGSIISRYRGRLVTAFATQWILLRGEKNVGGERVLVVGTGQSASLATWLFTNSRFSQAYTIVGLVDDDPRHINLKIDGARVLGSSRDIPSLVRKLDIGLIVYTDDNTLSGESQSVLRLCRQTPARLVLLPDTLRFFRAQLANPSNVSVSEELSSRAVCWLAHLEKASSARNWDWVEEQMHLMRVELSKLRIEEKCKEG
jgi:lipopolysaccharide/colanic/teichoic acid biosynthesis glycosyltransferase